MHHAQQGNDGNRQLCPSTLFAVLWQHPPKFTRPFRSIPAAEEIASAKDEVGNEKKRGESIKKYGSWRAPFHRDDRCFCMSVVCQESFANTSKASSCSIAWCRINLSPFRAGGLVSMRGEYYSRVLVLHLLSFGKQTTAKVT